MTRILIVDDKEVNLYYLRTVLTGYGWTVESACHGAEALVKARLNPPDLLVSDLLMPVMDGYTLLRHWKADGRLGKIPFIVYTATYTEEEDERLALNLGADAFILKPAEPEDFVARIREVQANAAASVPTEPKHPVGDEKELLKVYSETLIRKLEEKTLQLEEANRALKQDIAERQAVEVALRESEGRYRTLFEYAPDGILIADAESYYLDANASALRMLGLTRDELIGLHATDIVDRTEIPRVGPALRLIKAGSGYHREWKFRRKDDSTFVAEVIATKMPDGNLLAMIRDITERKALEQQFLRAQRMESIGTLASGVAHDLNNILAPIMMSVPMLRRELSDEDREGIISTVETSAERGAQIVRQVLVFGRGLGGDMHPLQFGPLIEEMLKVIHRTFPKEIAVESWIDPELWPVLGDATPLHQVLLNLCINARDAMPDGGRLRLRVSNVQIDRNSAGKPPESTPGPHVQLEVSDNGTGIPPETLERIFDPFFTTKGVGKGSGLGLSTVHGIVKSHGGFIKVASEPGRGTTFQVWLPATPDQAVSPAAASLPRPPAGRGELILVVDDEPAIVRAAWAVLQPHGYRVLLATDGNEALAAFARNPDAIALVISDLMMPYMGGVTLIRALRKLKPGIAVIASTGLRESAQLGELSAMGIENVLHKPYTADVLLRAIQKVLHPSAADPGRSKGDPAP